MFSSGLRSMSSRILLSSGHSMPIIGLGTWQTDNEESIEKSLETAIECGYRSIDTAFVYKNETLLGKKLNEMILAKKVSREDLFITTKLPINGLRPKNVEYFFQKSLKALQLEYVDLYLIHSPVACQRTSDDYEIFPFKDGDVLVDNVDIIETWHAMESLVERGVVKSIGISNFNSKQIQRIYNEAKIKPANLQVECHAYFPQHELFEFCKSLNISLTAYSPIGSPGLEHYVRKHSYMEYNKPKLLDDPCLTPLAEKHSKSPAQILLRYLTQRGIIPIPKSKNPKRIKENIEVFDFELDSSDMKTLNSMAKGYRYFTFDFAKSLKEHPEQPFNIPF